MNFREPKGKPLVRVSAKMLPNGGCSIEISKVGYKLVSVESAKEFINHLKRSLDEAVEGWEKNEAARNKNSASDEQ